MRKLLFAVALLFMSGFAYNVSVVSQISYNSCPVGWEEIASLNGTTNSHVAAAGDINYKYKLCVKGDFIITGGTNDKTSLTTNQSVIIGLKNTNSHAESPQYNNYTKAAYASCPVEASIKTSCGAEENCIIEFYKQGSNTHVAECGTGLTYKLCAKAVEPDTNQYACTCNFPSAGWNSDYFVGTLGTCCGDDSGEKETPAALDGSCSPTASTVCCANNQCGRNNGGTPSCDAVGSSCSSYLCSESTWQKCTATPGDYCNKVDLDNNGLYDQFCDNSTGNWVLTANMSDYCQTSCEQLNGIWTSKNILPSDPQNCCSSADSGLWCVSSTNRVTKCNNGKPIDCAVYCDTQGSINDNGNIYNCTSASDLDCKSSGCSGSNCACSKGEGTGCFVSSACISNNCDTYKVKSREENYFSTVNNKTGFAGICCPANSCPFDSDGNGQIDSCAQDGTSSIDSDNDGDVDYCSSGTWQECSSYSCTAAGACSCMSNSTGKGSCDYITEVAGTYSTGTGACYIQNSTLDCALPCDTDSDTGTREYINNAGLCVKGGGSCLDIYKSVEWFGNSSLSFVNASVNCLCDAQAYCTVDVYNDTGLYYSTSKNIAATGGWDLIPLNNPFAKGQNTINMTCSCGSDISPVPPSSCEVGVTSLNYEATSLASVPSLKVANPETISVTVNNIGSVDLSGFIIGATITNGGVSITNFTTQKYLAAGASTVVPVVFDIPTTMFNDTKLTGTNTTSVIVFSNVTDVLLMHTQEDNSYAYQCAAANDCTNACPSPAANCWQSGTSASNFTCSTGVCCPVTEHFEDGACCTAGYRCCISDSTCTTEEWCANGTSYNNYGITWSCNDVKLDGQTCTESRMCGSGNCENADLGGETYCCEAVLTLTEAGGECSTITGGEVCSSTGCCTTDNECSSGSWCTPFGNRCVACPTSTDSGYFNGYCSSDQCIGNDADCCTTDTDCSTAESISGNSYYCNGQTSTCETCTNSLDYYCPSYNKCYQAGPGTGDPDCCATDADCFSGNTCTGNTCVPKNIGKFCSTDAECGDGLSCIEATCVLDDFLIVNPTTMDMNVGEIRYASIIVRDPALKSDTYTLSLSGDYLQFAQINSGTAMTINLEPNEVKKFNMVLFGGAAVSNGQLKVFASSQTVSGISSEKSLTLNINQVAGSGIVAAAPGITFGESLAVLVIGGVLAWSLKKL